MNKQEAIATILVNQKFMRKGVPPIVNALDLLPANLRDEVMDDASAVIEGLKAARTVPQPGPRDNVMSDAEATLRHCIIDGLSMSAHITGASIEHAQVQEDDLINALFDPIVRWCLAAYAQELEKAGL